MKKIYIICFILTFSSFLYANTYDDIAKSLLYKVRNKSDAIAVLPFGNSGVAVAVQQEMISALINAGGNIVERDQLDKIIHEQSLQMTGLISNETVTEIGKGVGAKYIVTGTITEFERSGYESKGLKIYARIISVQTFAVLAVAAGDVDSKDAVSSYKRRSPKSDTGYPTFLELFGGASFLRSKVDYKHPVYRYNWHGSAGFKPGVIAGLRHMKSSKGFISFGWEFFYFTHIYDDLQHYRQNHYNINMPIVIRIPLWHYAASLPDYTHLYFGASLGLSLVYHPYYNNYKKKATYGVGENIYFLGGFKLGITESISINFEYRYMLPDINYVWHLQKFMTKSTVVTNRYQSHQILCGLSFAP